MPVCHGLLARYVKLRDAHVPGMLGAFFPPPWVSDPDMHHGTCVTHVPWCRPGSLNSDFLLSRWRGKRSRYYRHMRNPHLYVSDKRPIAVPVFTNIIQVWKPRLINESNHYLSNVMLNYHWHAVQSDLIYLNLQSRLYSFARFTWWDFMGYINR